MSLGRPLICLDRVGSTMEMATSMARLGAGEGTCVAARFQDAGRGRANRPWSAPPDTALLCSVVLRPALSLARLTPMAILTADAIASAVVELTGLQPHIKWPNDVLIDGRKLSGVLIQTFRTGGSLVVIVGMGINANIPADSLPDGATSLLHETGEQIDIAGLREVVLRNLDRRYRALSGDAIQSFWDGIQRKLAMRGERVAVVDGERTITGTLLHVDADGSLLLEDGGRCVRIVSGDLARGPRRMSDC